MDPDFIRELFQHFRPVEVRRMFGGAGIFCDGLMIGLIFDGAVYLKVDDEAIPAFEREGSKPFVYTHAKSPGRVGKASLNYWRMPERLYDDPDELAQWARRSFAIAQLKKSAAKVRTPRKGALVKSSAKKSKNKREA